ncbi:MAG: response regulator [Firmicutes bacterium]|nr:response regulator [Bacillota bacterium]
MKERAILLVEDNPDDEELTLVGLKRSGLPNEIHVVRDGNAALDFLLAEGDYCDRDPKDIPALILLDLKLPKIGGLDVLRKIRANPITSCVPVVILTSSSEEEDVVASYKMGVNSFVCKPVEFDRFADAVRQLGLYWLLLNEPPTLGN